MKFQFSSTPGLSSQHDSWAVDRSSRLARGYGRLRKDHLVIIMVNLKASSNNRTALQAWRWKSIPKRVGSGFIPSTTIIKLWLPRILTVHENFAMATFQNYQRYRAVSLFTHFVFINSNLCRRELSMEISSSGLGFQIIFWHSGVLILSSSLHVGSVW